MEFSSSELGRHEYWDEAYKRELSVFEDTGDIGEVWFGEDTQERMVRWIADDSDLPLTTRILELGCGNGALLMSLKEEGFTDLTGADYSEFSIQLAQRIAEKENATSVKFQTCDILAPSEAEKRAGQYDLCVDKGTFDAICLKDTSDPSDRLAYIRSVHQILAHGGQLLLTSCNWTQDELETEFCNDFEVVGEIPAPSFTFGGKKGQTVTTLIMKRKDKSS